METFTISQLAEQTQINVQTVRYYERRGILPKPKRRQSGYREYNNSDVQKILFIKRAQNLGFTLEEISELLLLRVDPESNCQNVCSHATEKVKEIEQKIQELKQMKQALERLIDTCQAYPEKKCMILDFLEGHRWNN